MTKVGSISRYILIRKEIGGTKKSRLNVIVPIVGPGKYSWEVS